MATQMTASLVLQLEDQLSAGLSRLEQQFERLRGAGQGLGLGRLEESEGFLDRLSRGLDGIVARAGRAVAAIRGVGETAIGGIGEAAHGVMGAAGQFSEAAGNLVNRGFGAAVEGFVVYEPAKQYAEWDNTLRQIGITEHLSGQALNTEMARLNTVFSQDALKTGQSSQSIAHAYLDLIGTGLPANEINQAIGVHSEAATAYGIAPDEMGHAVGAMLQNLKVPVSDLGGALAAMAYATQSGLFKMQDFSRELPGISGAMAALGIHGRAGLDQASAAIEIVQRNSSNPGQAAANLFDAFNHLTAPRDRNNFKKVGFDLDAILKDAEKKGKNPFDAVLDKIQHLVEGKGPVAGAIAIGQLFTNAQDKSAFLALLEHRAEFDKLRGTLDGISKLKLDIDFASAHASPEIQIANINEAGSQLIRVLGEGFMPVLTMVAGGLVWVTEKLQTLDKEHPVLLHRVLEVVAGLLLFGATLTLLGAVVPLMVAGFGLVVSVLKFMWSVVTFVLSPIGLLLVAIAAVAAAAYDIYENWAAFRPFFVQMWEGVKEAFHGFLQFLHGVFTLNFGEAAKGLQGMWHGLTTFLGGELKVMEKLFVDLGHWVDGWTGGLASRILAGITHEWPVLVAGFHHLLDQLMAGFDDSMLGRLLGLEHAPQLAGVGGSSGAVPGSTLHGTLTLVHQGAAPALVGATSNQPGMTFHNVPDRGQTANRR